MAENKNAQQVREITDKLEQGIKELFESERFKEYLRTMSKFYNYSFNNTLLIAMQKPEATYVAGYTSWQRNFDRQVMKGEKGIKILAPAPYKTQEEREKVDPVTQKPVIGADGKAVTETVEVLRPAFKVVSVFDVSQTDGKELPDIIVDELKGTVENYEAFFDALKQESPVPISFEDIPGGAKGFFSPVESRIAIQEGMSEIQTVKTAIHEIAHAKLHAFKPDEKAAPEDKKDRHTKEVEAESVAYTVCQRYGIETSDYSFGYILSLIHISHNYDEYHFDLDDIEHDPYVLISILSALHEGEFTLDEVQGTLQMLFEKQYILTEEVIVETRYRTETDTWTDADGNTHTETYRVPYDYYICNVKLENFNLSHVPVYIMGQEQLSMYATYMSVLGNREDLFGDSPYVDKYITNPPADYNVNPEYLNDEKFATLITEAEKYLGYPYVWGGSNPDTSFDCSGFVSYVLTNSGLVNTGRLGAQGLYNISTPVSKANAQPGDLIFFVGTYDTPGVSHVGIYVGDGVMIHCGDPIQYTSINSSYWQQHFYAFGRPAY